MTSPVERSGNIYDLGYRHYDGARLGRAHAIQALYIEGLRACFGLGRRPLAKVAPWALAILALAPATAQLAIAAASPQNFDLIHVEDYFSFVNIIIILFVAVVAPELTGRDQRHRTLSLYFSRALKRDDYALARFASLATATLMVSLVPTLILFIGNALAADSASSYAKDHWKDVPRLAAGGLLVATVLGAFAMAVASQTARRTFAMGGIVAPLLIIQPVAIALADSAGRYFMLLGPIEVLRGAILWIFGVDPGFNEPLGRNPINGAMLFLVAVALAVVSIAITLRRYRRVAA